MSDMDIRNWLRENRPDIKVGQRGRLSPAAKDAYDEAHGVSDGNFLTDMLNDEVTTVKEMTEPVFETDEVAPQPPKKKGLFSFGDPDKPRGERKRVSTSKIVSGVWAGMGALLLNPQLAPVARTLQVQAPVAGEIAEDMIKGTPVDKLLQPLARVGEKGEEAFALIGPPAISMAICMQPDLYPMLEPVMVEALKSWVLIAGPKIRKAQQKEAKLVEELGEDYGSSIREMLQFIFAPFVQETPDAQYAGV